MPREAKQAASAIGLDTRALVRGLPARCEEGGDAELSLPGHPMAYGAAGV
jgi:hypothetical protein